MIFVKYFLQIVVWLDCIYYISKGLTENLPMGRGLGELYFF